MLGSDTNGAHHPSLQLAPKPHAPVSTRNPYAQSAKREAVLALVSQLEALNPTPQPLQHMDRLEGDWRLLYSTITITVRGGPRDTSALRLECPPHGSTHATQRRRRFLAPLAQPGWARLAVKPLLLRPSVLLFNEAGLDSKKGATMISPYRTMANNRA